MNYFSSNATYQSNATQEDAHSHERVDEPATKKKHQINSHRGQTSTQEPRKPQGYTTNQSIADCN